LKQKFRDMLTHEQIEALRLKYFDIVNDAAYVFDFKDGKILDANGYLAELLGYTHDELLRLTVFDIHPSNERARMLELIDVFKHEGQVKGLDDMHLMRKDGTLVPVEKNGTLFTLEGRKVIQCTCRDITVRKQFEAELNRRVDDMRILNSIALEITSGLELEELLPRITKSAVELLDADAGAVGIYDERRGILVYRYLYGLPEHLGNFEIPLDAGMTSVVLQSGQTMSVNDYHTYPRAIKEFKDAGIRAIIMAPLLIENKLLGTLIATHMNPENNFDSYDIRLLEAIARQAAIAIYNAQLFHDMKENAEFGEALNEFSSIIGSTPNLGRIYGLMCEEATRLFRASGAYLYTIDANKGRLVGTTAYGARVNGFLKVGLSLDEPSLASYIYHTRKPVLANDVENNPVVKPEMTESFESKTLMGTPIIVDGEVRAVLILSSSVRPYYFTEVQLERASILSNQVAFAIKNADLYGQIRQALEHERYVALTLQQSLLPEEIPEVAGLDIGAHYGPSRADEALVGGDFYDFIKLPDGRVSIIIGDVSGKGIEAAAITAMIKYAVRSFALKDPEPSFVLTHANHVVSMQLEPGQFVSLCCALYDPATGTLDFANAGHPYPIHLKAADETYAPIRTTNPVFGVMPSFDYVQIKKTLNEGDILVLYTDGLIEARSEREFFGTAGIITSLRRNRELGAKDIALRLVHDSEVFAKGNLTDDVAILVLKKR